MSLILSVMTAMARVSAKTGVPMEDIAAGDIRVPTSGTAERKAPDGKFRIVATDKSCGTEWVHMDCLTLEEALDEARSSTEFAKPVANDYSNATIYAVYDPCGKYLGGDTWKDQ